MGHLYHGELTVSHSQRVYSVLRTCVIVFMGLGPQDIPRSCGWQGFLHVQKGGDTDGEPPGKPEKHGSVKKSRNVVVKYTVVYPPEKGVVSTKAGDMSHDMSHHFKAFSQDQIRRVGQAGCHFAVKDVVGCHRSWWAFLPQTKRHLKTNRTTWKHEFSISVRQRF